MKNKIHEERMKTFFIQATKELLKGEGIKSISVRNIAEKAGYSFATLYNYFRDVNELVFLCILDFQKECKQFVEQKVKTKNPSVKRLKEKLKAYISFFVEYPDIFDLFFVSRVNDFGNKKDIIETINNSLSDICKKDIDFYSQKKAVNSDFFENKVKYIITGILLFYLNRRIPVSYKEFSENVERQIDGILD